MRGSAGKPLSSLSNRAAWLATRAASLELRVQLPLRPMIETENSQTTWP